MVGKTKNQILSPVIILTLQGTSKEQIQVALDNTLPEVSIIAPKDKENVQQGINLLASTSDPHLESYRLDYTKDLAANEWDQMCVKGDL